MALTELVAGTKLFEYVRSKTVTSKSDLANDAFYNDLRAQYTGHDLELINGVIDRTKAAFAAAE